MVASADIVEIDGIYYNLNAEEKVAEVTSNPNKYSGEVDIPASVTYNDVEYSVTSIGNKAFQSCSSLTSITIPNSVTSIGSFAFANCTNLSSIVVESSNTVYDSRGNCNAIIETSTNKLIAGCKDTIIPNSVTSIGDGAFGGCSSLTSITIPNSVTSIGNDAFNLCSNLYFIAIPNSVTSIGEGAFYLCSNLTSIAISNSVTSIGDYAFSYCSNLISITLPNSVTSIGERAFGRCFRLTSVTIPNSVISIGDGAFEDCWELADVYCYAVNVPQTVTDAFDDSKVEYATLHVPDESLEQYKNTSPWSSFGKIVGLSTEIIFIEKDHSASVLIQNNGGMLTVQGAQDGTPVSVYSIAGTEAGSAVSQNSMACISTSMQQGDIAIVRIGNRSVKVVLK